MSMAAAPRPESEPFECNDCESELVLYDGDKVCMTCGLVPGPREVEGEDPWTAWREHRDENYDGFYGPERVKMVGGFLGAWDFSEDDLFN